jgi:hypothetical protein
LAVQKVRTVIFCQTRVRTVALLTLSVTCRPFGAICHAAHRSSPLRRMMPACWLCPPPPTQASGRRAPSSSFIR